MKNHGYLMVVVLFCSVLMNLSQAVVHPGCLSTQADLDRMREKVAAGQQPWKGSWDRLRATEWGKINWGINPQAYPCAGGVCDPRESFIPMARDVAHAYQCALQYHILGDTAYADEAVRTMNAWADTMVAWTGDSNHQLRAGLYGYQWACTAEIMRHYSGWSSAEQYNFKNFLLDKFYVVNSDFLIRHNNTCWDHYWLNWDMASMCSMLSIGIYCDRQDIIDEAVDYFLAGSGTGRITHAFNYLHESNTIAQCQESGRDQGHAVMAVGLTVIFCEIAWRQGYDLYGVEDNLLLKGCEYTARYNLGNSVPFHEYTNCGGFQMTDVSSAGRGIERPYWDMVVNHYVGRRGLSAPYSTLMAESLRPDGGPGNYESASGGYDIIGFSTLTHYGEAVCNPSTLTPFVQVDGGAWQSTTNVSVDAGQDIRFGPRPLTGGTWNWSGPNGYAASTRETTLSNIQLHQAGTYTATFTNDCGTQSSLNFNVTVNGGSGSGTILREWWTGITGTAVVNLTSHANFPNYPTGSEQVTSLEGPTNWADNYGTRLRGYLHPPATGNYTFWISGDDNCDLYLSSDGNPAYASLIAYVPGWTYLRQWNKFPEQQSSSIPLTGGQMYYIEALHKEGTGGDNIAVAWAGPGFSQQIIDGYYLSPWSGSCDPTALTPFVQVDGGAWQSTTNVSVDAGQDIMFGPRPLTGGTWNWSGPNGYTASTREITLSNIQTSQAGTYTATFTNDCGAQSSLNFNVTVNSRVLSFEAENGTLGSRWRTGTDGNASNDTYLEINPSYNHTGSSPQCISSECLVTYPFTVSTGGNCKFWFRIMSNNGNDDSFFWRIDSGSWQLENNRNSYGAWYARDNAMVDNLSAGSHVLQITYRENGTRLDKFVIQPDSEPAPTGEGPPENSQGG